MRDTRLGQLATEKNLFKVTAVLMLLIPVSEILTEIGWRFSHEITPSLFQPVILGLYGALGTLLVVLCKAGELKNAKWYASDVFYLLLVFFMAISAVFSKNPGVYSDGIVLISENPLHFLAYYALFFSGTRIKSSEYRRKLLILLLVIAAVQGVVAFFQTFNIEIAQCLLIRHDRAAYGLTQNSNYYGGLSVFLLACISGVYLFSEKISRSKAFRFAMPVFAGFVFYTMMGSRARLAWAGFIAMTFFFIVSGLVMIKGNIGKDELKRFFIRFAVLAVVFAVVFALTHVLTNFVSEEIQRTQYEVEGKVDAGLGSDRLINWEYGIESIPHHWLTGIGLDNYREVFFENPRYVEGTYFQDKAHNEYLHVMATQGVLAFAVYVVLFIRICVLSVKRVFRGGDDADQAYTWIFLGMFVTYLAQAFLNTSVINVAMYFWLVAGLLEPCETPIKLINKQNNK